MIAGGRDPYPGPPLRLESVGDLFGVTPFRTCHAATVLETADGLLAAWFAGRNEGASDTAIWLARWERATAQWSRPEPLAADPEEARTPRMPRWNPVLARLGGPGAEIALFYRVGPHPHHWWSLMARSTDEGRHFAPATRLPAGMLGPIKNKPIRREDGVLLCPSSDESAGWTAHVEMFDPSAPEETAWRRTASMNDPEAVGAIQPTLLSWPAGRVQALCRTDERFVGVAWSMDRGESWSRVESLGLVNPNSAIDAVTLADGRAVMAANDNPHQRSPLTLFVSDDGLDWRPALTLAAGVAEFSYPSVIQTGDGRIHVVFTARRRTIQHAVVAM